MPGVEHRFHVIVGESMRHTSGVVISWATLVNMDIGCISCCGLHANNTLWRDYAEEKERKSLFLPNK